MKNKTFILIVLSILIFTSCEPGSILDETISIGANIYNGADNFMNNIVKPELISYSSDSGASLTLVDSESDESLFDMQVDDLITQGSDVLLINLVNPTAASSLIQKAMNADIPLILYNIEPSDLSVMDDYDSLWYVGSDYEKSGTIQGEMILNDWNNNPDWDKNGNDVLDYVMLKGSPGHPHAEARTTGSVQALVDGGVAVNEIALEADPYWSTAHGYEKMTQWLTVYGADAIEVVIANNDGMALGALTAMEENNVSIPLYGVDMLDSAVEAIIEGKMKGTVLNDGKFIARTAVDMAINSLIDSSDVLAGTGLSFDSLETKSVLIPYVAINLSNYEQYQE